MQSQTHPLEKTQWPAIPITAYRGVVILKTKHGFKLWGRTVSSGEQVDELIGRLEKSSFSPTPKNNR